MNWNSLVHNTKQSHSEIMQKYSDEINNGSVQGTKFSSGLVSKLVETTDRLFSKRMQQKDFSPILTSDITQQITMEPQAQQTVQNVVNLVNMYFVKEENKTSNNNAMHNNNIPFNTYVPSNNYYNNVPSNNYNNVPSNNNTSTSNTNIVNYKSALLNHSKLPKWAQKITEGFENQIANVNKARARHQGSSLSKEQTDLLWKTFYQVVFDSSNPNAQISFSEKLKYLNKNTKLANQYSPFKEQTLKQMTPDFAKLFPTQRDILKQAHTSNSSPSPSSLLPSVTDLTNFIQTCPMSQGQHVLPFYKNGITAFLGNFSESPITYKGHQFDCVEAAFHWAKYAYTGDKNLSKFLSRNGLNGAKVLGQQAFDILRKDFEKKYQLPTNWHNGEKQQVMWDLLNLKFAHGTKLRDLLDATKGCFLLEHKSPKYGQDKCWSDAHDGTGDNLLGSMIAAVRDGYQWSFHLPVNKHGVLQASQACHQVDGSNGFGNIW